jgi:hypothetical protein
MMRCPFAAPGTATVFGLVLAACPSGGATDTSVRSLTPDGGTPLLHPGETSIAFVVTSLRYGKPTLKYFTVDVTLQNGAEGDRWFLFSESVTTTEGEVPGPVDIMYAYSVEGIGHAVASRFFGSPGFWAILLPAGGTATIRGVPVDSWIEWPEPTFVDVVIARSLTIDGVDARTRFPILTRADARVNGTLARAGRRHPEGGVPSEVPTAADVERRERIELRIR